MSILGYAIGIVLSYLIGSIPWGYIFGRLGGIDIRRWGSGNIGATNVARIMGARRGLVVLVLDILKGVAAAGLETAKVVEADSRSPRAGDIAPGRTPARRQRGRALGQPRR